MSSSNLSSSSADSTSKRFQSIITNGIKSILRQSAEYAYSFAERRPIFATLLALEVSSWFYMGFKAHLKSYIWWNTVLELNLKGDYTMKSRDPMAELFNPGLKNQLTFLQLLHTIKGASKDHRINGLFLRLDSSFRMGIAQCEELRAMLLEFRASAGVQKKIVVYADNFSQWGVSAVRQYYIASAADLIFMPDDGLLHLGPATVDFPFYKNTVYGKLEMEVEVRRRSQYKSAMNMFMNEEFDQFHKAQYTQLLAHLEMNFIDTIAKARRMRPYSVNGQLSAHPHILECVQWVVQQILEGETQLRFQSMAEIQKKNKSADTDTDTDTAVEDAEDSRPFECTVIQGISESKSEDTEEEEEEENAAGIAIDEKDNEDEDNNANTNMENNTNNLNLKNLDCNLIHCWSHYLGNYKRPKFYCILEFFDTDLEMRVYYEAIVKLPNKQKGQKQDVVADADDGDANTDDAEDHSGNVLREPKRVLERYKLLIDFQPGSKCVRICKPGDIQVSVDDAAYDARYDRSLVRESFKDVNIVIERNLADILHYGGYTSREAQQLSLIDGIKDFSEIYSEVWPKLLNLKEKKVSFLYLHRYYQRIFSSKLSKGIVTDKGGVASNLFRKYIKSSSTKIAYIGCTNGAIVNGKSTKDRIGSITVCRQLRAVRKKKNIKGVILHLDTPGGSATACHNMVQAIKAVQKDGIPVIAVQSNIAASGGYYLSAPCEHVITSASTITGSIGVIGAKFTTRQFWKSKLGVDHDRVTTNNTGASQFSMLDGFGAYERARAELMITQWYQRFKSVICKPRRMSMDNVEAVAKGQIWLGSQALEIGLVDEIGGLYDAIHRMKTILELPDTERIKFVNPLGKIGIWDMIMGAQPEHENDFSVPRTQFSSANLMSHLANPLSLMRYSHCLQLVFSNMIAAPFMSSICASLYKSTLPMAMSAGEDNNGVFAQISDDLAFLKEEIEMFNRTPALMYDISLAFYHRKQLF